MSLPKIIGYCIIVFIVYCILRQLNFSIETEGFENEIPMNNGSLNIVHVCPVSISPASTSPATIQPVYASPYDTILDPTVVVTNISNQSGKTLPPRITSTKINPILPQNADIPLENPAKDNPATHHPIHNSILRNISPRYDNVFYYEMPNDIYMDAFNQTFSLPCTTFYDSLKNDNWGPTIDALDAPSNITASYNDVLKYIEKKLNDSDYMKLKSQPKERPPIQIVHDIFKDYKIHLSQNKTFLLHIDVLLYREAKYNGKHIGIHVIVNTDNDVSNIYILEAELIGDVPSDAIAFFPVLPTSTYDINTMKIDDQNSIDYATILSKNNSGSLYTGFANTSESLEDQKAHVQDYINYATKNIGYINTISKMKPEEAVQVFKEVSGYLRNDILSSVSSEYAASVIQLMDESARANALAGMNREKAAQVLYILKSKNNLLQ
jgi:hypothetical protein